MRLGYYIDYSDGTVLDLCDGCANDKRITKRGIITPAFDWEYNERTADCATYNEKTHKYMRDGEVQSIECDKCGNILYE